MRTVLIVDDDDYARKLYWLMLAKRGFEVLEANDGREAIRVVEKRPVHIVITDIFMPEKDGFELIAYLRKMWPDIRIVAVSGGFSHPGRGFHLDSSQYLHMARGIGADIVLSKPVDKNAIIKAVDDLFEAQIVACGSHNLSTADNP